MKTFPVKLSDDLWAALSKAAIDSQKTLHQYILDALARALKQRGR